MELTWLGAAGFIVNTPVGEIAFDPFLSRSQLEGHGEASPFGPKSFENVRALFVGHGHFDHAFDIPRIAAATDLKIFAPGLTGCVLKLRGVPSERLFTALPGMNLFASLKMRAFHSHHVRFDWPLVLSTARRCGIVGCSHVARLGIAYPKGLVQSYLFECEGKKTLFLSTAGCTRQELETYRALEVDFLLAPLQGHSHIQDIVAKQTALIRPKVVVPHHYDDFYPPLSQMISVDDFEDRLVVEGYRGTVVRVPLFGTVQV